jgi:hypothetical protein
MGYCTFVINVLRNTFAARKGFLVLIFKKEPRPLPCLLNFNTLLEKVRHRPLRHVRSLLSSPEGNCNTGRPLRIDLFQRHNDPRQ